jgi:hypothetical protein
MTGETVWQVFLATTISHKNLELLGHDLYFMRDKPGKEGAIAVTALGEHFSLKPQHMYIALNTDPGRSTLETLAQDFEAKKPWAIASKSTQAYAEKIAKNIDFIKAKLAMLLPPPPPTGGIAPKTVPRSSAPSTTCPAGPKGPAGLAGRAGPDLRNTGLFMLIAGSVAYFVVGFLRYAKIPTLRKPKMA